MSELRKDPIVNRWVIIAAERGRRPSDFKAEAETPKSEGCPFCEGNEAKTPAEIFALRDPGPPNSPGWRVRVVPNKFPALAIEGELVRSGIGRLDHMTGIGAHEVIIESPRHSDDLPTMTAGQVVDVLCTYAQRTCDLRRDERVRHMMVFRNYQAQAGASLSHPHSQLIALPFIPQLVKEKLASAREHYLRKERCIFCDLLEQELASPERVIYRNDHFVVLSPFAARFPFSVEIYPLEHCHDFVMMDSTKQYALADVLQYILQQYKTTLPDPAYNMTLQTSPSTSPRPGRPDYWGTIAYDYHWHLELFPRLTKMAGFEWGTGCYINPVSPEAAAEYLRENPHAPRNEQQ